MGFQVDFLAVGEGKKSGDAIALRFGDLHGSRENQTVFVIDGGTKDSGERLREHIEAHYETGIVDYVVCTHPDADHSSGLSVVMENMSVGALLMHQPWDHSERIKDDFVRPISEDGLEKKIRKSLKNAHDLEKIAKKKNIPVIEPFAGIGHDFGNGRLDILGPSKEFYVDLLPEFRVTPKSASVKDALIGAFDSAMDVAKDWIDEEFHFETLQNGMPDHRFSAENRSSAILLFEIDGYQILLTGDADEEALSRAIDYLESTGRSLHNLRLFQMPHHGSRHNIGPDVLDRILGRRQASFVDTGISTYISASVDGHPKHPHASVTNAAHRRGSNAFATQGSHILKHNDAPQRAGWGPIEPIPFVARFES